MQFPSSLRASLVAICVSAVMFGQAMTVARVKDFIKSAIQRKNVDKDVAAALAGMKLTERFTLSDLGDLQDAGAGPRTLAALATMVTQSASLAQPQKVVPVATPTGPPDPPEAEKKQVLAKTREWALDYVKSLPDFLCLEDTNRSLDTHYKAGTAGSWSLQDRVVEKLTFFDHKENYELYMHNDTVVINKNTSSLGGARSTGEWASLLGQIFEPASQTSFQWTAWATVRGHLTYRYRYVITRPYSQYTVAHGDSEKIGTGISGDLFIEKGTNKVLRATVVPEIPPDFPVQDVNQIVDYDYQPIGGETYLLPLKSEVRMRDGQIGSLNEIRWRSYRKYSADTTLKFDDLDTPEPKK